MGRRSRDRVFRALLRLFPAEFRGDFGGQMAADFQDQHEETRGRSAVAMIALWLRTVIDAMRRAPLEHLDVFRRDASYALRVLRKRPASTITVVVSLAIGIGCNTAVFSVVNGVLWRSLPFPNSQRLVRVRDRSIKDPGKTDFLSNGEFVDVRERTRTMSSMGAGGYTTETIVEPGEPEALRGMTVTEGLFETLGVQPIVGRTFTQEEYARAGSIDSDRARANRDWVAPHDGAPLPLSAIIISRALWQRRFLGRSDVLGQQLRLASGITVEVVGVMGPDIDTVANAWQAPEWWMPQPPSRAARGAQMLDVFGRLAPGQTLQTAQAELTTISGDEARAFPKTNHDRLFESTPLLDTVVLNARATLLFLFGAVACVLLVTCVNVVHLFLANAAGRRVELATRVALGATRGHLIRQTLTESVLLAAAGGGGGLILAAWGVPVLVALAQAGVAAEGGEIPVSIPRLLDICVDWSTFAFAAAVTLSVALVCGLAASLPLTRLSVWTALADGRSGSSLHGRRVRNALTVCEIAVALMLVVASILMVRTIRSLATMDLGFNPTGVITAALPRPANVPLDNGALARLHASDAAVIDQVRRLPGVVAAGVGGSPMGLRMGVGGVTVGDEARDIGGMVGLSIVSVGYLEALGARLKAGRFFTEEDRPDTPAVAILGESTARRFWPNEDVLGHVFRLPGTQPVEARVVGVVADMAAFGLVTKEGGIYLPHLQSQSIAPVFGQMLIRTHGDPRLLAPAIKTIVRRVNSQTPFAGITTIQEEIDRATAPRRFVLQLIGIFSVLGVVLAMIGIYGVVSESIAGRVREIGVRIALGAQRSDVINMVLAHGTRMLIAGLAIGVAGALALRQQLASLVFGVSTMDLWSYVAACAALTAAALAACAIPARRAARLDPIVALRTE